MSDTEIDLRRVVLQTLESWNAAGVSHLAAVPVSLAPPPAEAEIIAPASEPQPAVVQIACPPVSESPPESVPETLPEESANTEPPPELNSPMAKKTATKKQEWFETDEAPAPTKPAPTKKKLSRDERVAELKILSEKVAKCTRCPELASTRTQTVFGVGNPQAKVVFIGEAPGADEDAQGEPFVGRAGQLLNKIIEAMKLKREEIYICNVLRCRPPGNRLPSPEEAGHCREYLDGQLSIINPEYIVCWGSCAAQNLLNMTDSIGKLRKRFFEYGNARVLCTYHPSYLLRNPAAKKDVWEDMKILMKELGIPID